MRSRLCAEMSAEAAGSYILCFFGPGAVAVSVLTGGHKGLWQVASVWGFAIALAIYAVGSVSGAHLNPAVTLAMAVYRKFPAGKVLPYVLAQMIGGVLAAATLLVLFNGTCLHFEATHHLVRGMPGSQLSAMWFGEYFPNPAVYGTDAEAFVQVGVKTAFVAEAVGTAFLLFFIMALSDPPQRRVRRQSEPASPPHRLGGGHHHRHRGPADAGGTEPDAGLRPAGRGVLRGVGDHRHPRPARRGHVGLHPRPAGGRPGGCGGVPGAHPCRTPGHGSGLPGRGGLRREHSPRTTAVSHPL